MSRRTLPGAAAVSPGKAKGRRGRVGDRNLEQEDALGLQDAQAEADQLAHGLDHDAMTEAASGAAASVLRDRVDGERAKRLAAEEKLKAAEAKRQELERKIAELSQGAGGSSASTAVS